MKVKEQKLPEPVKKALQMLQEAGFEAYIVGGCVRDYLMGKTPHDFDITTSAKPEETLRVFSQFRAIETGIAHGTVTVLLGDEPLEITTYRIEGTYSDGRHPDQVAFTPNLSEDLKRRDFTINAMAFDREYFVDLFEGQQDLERGIIRCVGNPAERFQEDGLRIMRALRFASVLDFQIEEATFQAALDNRSMLQSVSAERIRVELDKLLCGKAAGRILMEGHEILSEVIPELTPLAGFDQHNIHHIYDLLEHTAVAVDAIEPSPVLRLAAFFHDFGKAETFFMGDDNQGHFYGHAKVSAAQTDAIMRRLKYDNATRKDVVLLVVEHDRPIEETDKAIRRAMAKFGVPMFFDLLLLKRADNLAQNPDYRYRQNYYDRLEARAHALLEESQCFSIRNMAINGNDLQALGVEPGPRLGQLLNQAFEQVLDETLPNERDALLEYVKSKL